MGRRTEKGRDRESPRGQKHSVFRMFGRMSEQKGLDFFDYQTGEHCLLFKEIKSFLFVMSRTFRNTERFRPRGLSLPLPFSCNGMSVWVNNDISREKRKNVGRLKRKKC